MKEESQFLKKTKEVIAKNQDVLAVFEEPDRTGKFRVYCRQNGINMSGKIETYIRAELKPAIKK